jgi:diaminopimelate decarboxylase
MKNPLHPRDWGLGAGPTGELLVGDCSTVDLAKIYGTPLHVVNEQRLEETARHFRRATERFYPGRTFVHYAFKCNSVPAIIKLVQRAGLKAEVMSEFELDLALHLGYGGDAIVVNGPCKTDAFLRKCLEKQVRFIVVDSLDELKALGSICASENRHAAILLRVNPDYTPERMNSGSATGSRRGCAFGLDLKGGELTSGLRLLLGMKNVQFFGFHFHIGTGIRSPEDYVRALRCLKTLVPLAGAQGLPVKVVDVGGGFPSPTSREMTSRELLIYQAFSRLPSAANDPSRPSFEDFAGAIGSAIMTYFPDSGLPELLFEPGRSIVSANQLLLLTVHRVKDRPRVRKWLITDGGLGTVTLPTFYEYHEVLLANDVRRPRTEKVTISGPACFAADTVYLNKPMPKVAPGEVLAVMDSGAYFTALESSFGFPHPAIIAANGKTHRLIRRAESFSDMIGRDVIEKSIQGKEDSHEVYHH